MIINVIYETTMYKNYLYIIYIQCRSPHATDIILKGRYSMSDVGKMDAINHTIKNTNCLSLSLLRMLSPSQGKTKLKKCSVADFTKLHTIAYKSTCATLYGA